MRLGLLGGTFDPPHVGHLMVAQDALEALDLDRVLFIPAAVPPHKQGQVTAPAKVRLEMLRAAIAGDPRFAADDMEIRRPGPSYTVTTLRELREREPDSRLFFLAGTDQMRELHTWKEPQEIARLATLVAVSREGAAVNQCGCGHLPLRSIQVTRIDLSATHVRRRVAEGRSIRYLVPEGVEAIIRREGLYREPDR